MKSNASAGQKSAFQVVDMRPADRFEGRANEPRPGLTSGHMPHSRNLPWAEMVKDGVLTDAAEVRRRFESIGLDLTKPIVTSCGSGVTACVLNVTLATLGVDAALYDGSWADWGRVDLGNPALKGKSDD